MPVPDSDMEAQRLCFFHQGDGDWESQEEPQRKAMKAAWAKVLHRAEGKLQGMMAAFLDQRNMLYLGEFQR